MRRNSGIRRWVVLLAVLCSLSLPVLAGPEGEQAGKGAAVPDSKAAFEKLKGLAGRWRQTLVAGGSDSVEREYRVSGNGTVVVETISPGAADEMVTMFRLDGDELVLDHYCALGNQPRMKLEWTDESGNELQFNLTGGTNLDPAKDTHIHAMRFVFFGEDYFGSQWTIYSEGKDGGGELEQFSRVEGDG